MNTAWKALLWGLLLGLVAYLVVRPFKESGWRSIQDAYNRLQDKKGLATIDVGIRSIDVPGRPHADRCVTCHLGMILPDAHDGLYAAHPETLCAMVPSQIGCTPCHRGDGLQLSVQEAHGLKGNGSNALLGKDARIRFGFHLQSACAQCHVRRREGLLRYDVAAVPDAADGMNVFMSQGCTSCHRIPGVYNAREYGPPLGEIALGRSRHSIRNLLLAPQQSNALSPMPPVSLSPQDLDKLLVFLLAQRGLDSELGSSPVSTYLAKEKRPSLQEHLDLESPPLPNPGLGALWVQRSGCAGCHRTGDNDVGVPDLRYVAWTTSVEEMRLTLEDPQKRFPGTYMPKFEVPTNILLSVVEYLGRQRTVLPSSPRDMYQEVCRRCHGQEPDPKVVVLGTRPPMLVSSKVPIEKFVETVTHGKQGTAMKPWGKVLSAEFVRGIHSSLDQK